MRRITKILNVLMLVSALTSLALAEKRAMTVEDLWSMKRIGAVELSPDGKWLVFEQTVYDMDQNSGKTDLWWVPAGGGQVRQLTTHQASSRRPRWKPDGSGIAFLAARQGGQQVYSLPMNGGEAVQLTHLPVDVDDFVWSPTGDRLAFTASVFPQAKDLTESAAMDKARSEVKVKAHIADHLLFRPWNRWADGMRSHVYVCDVDGDNVIDLTPGDYDAPPLDLGGLQDFVFSPDGAEVAFVSNRNEMVAANTNNDIFLISAVGGEAMNLTTANEAVDKQPVYSPDCKYLVYRAMKRAGFEADKYDLILYNRQTRTRESLTEAFNLTVEEVIWAPDGSSLFFNAEDDGRVCIYRLDLKSKKIQKLITDHVNSNLMISPDGRTLYFKRQSNVMPNELFSYDLRSKSVRQLTFINQPLLAQLEMNRLEDISYPSFDGKTVHGFLLKPPFFDPAKKYPLLVLIHGGPQGMWSDDFHYRWNTSMFAARGFVVAAFNIRGSKGYGQAWCDEVSRNWGGGPYQDIMAGVDYVLHTFDFVDPKKLAAAGASYGGYMINWIATQTDRFDVLVSHAGVFDLLSKYGATDELWFPEWEFGGIPYEQPELYRQWSPSAFAANLNKFRTPMLLTHGELDFRVPVTQAYQMFTALQRYGVPSRLVSFPDETHFVAKPQNARLWWNEVFSWLERWLNEK